MTRKQSSATDRAVADALHGVSRRIAARTHGIHERTLRRALRAIGVPAMAIGRPKKGRSEAA